MKSALVSQFPAPLRGKNLNDNDILLISLHGDDMSIIFPNGENEAFKASVEQIEAYKNIPEAELTVTAQKIAKVKVKDLPFDIQQEYHCDDVCILFQYGIMYIETLSGYPIEAFIPDEKTLNWYNNLPQEYFFKSKGYKYICTKFEKLPSSISKFLLSKNEDVSNIRLILSRRGLCILTEDNGSLNLKPTKRMKKDIYTLIKA
jgi:hypothetical protein